MQLVQKLITINQKETAPWMCMDVHRYPQIPWVSMDTHQHPWILSIFGYPCMFGTNMKSNCYWLGVALVLIWGEVWTYDGLTVLGKLGINCATVLVQLDAILYQVRHKVWGNLGIIISGAMHPRERSAR